MVMGIGDEGRCQEQAMGFVDLHGHCSEIDLRAHRLCRCSRGHMQDQGQQVHNGHAGVRAGTVNHQMPKEGKT